MKAIRFKVHRETWNNSFVAPYFFHRGRRWVHTAASADRQGAHAAASTVWAGIGTTLVRTGSGVSSYELLRTSSKSLRTVCRDDRNTRVTAPPLGRPLGDSNHSISCHSVDERHALHLSDDNVTYSEATLEVYKAGTGT